MRFDEYIGMRRDKDGPGDSAQIDIEPHHCNPTGNINGGVLISLADNLSTHVANDAFEAKTGERKFMVGIDLHAVMLANQLGGSICATAAPVRVGRRVTVIRTEVRGTDERLLAVVTTTHVPS